jgi:sec-independent protein translocase protein TatA
MDMIGDLFDSPWKVLIVAVVLVVLFGSKKLPDTARSLGKSMRILKTEIGSLHEDEPAAGLPVKAPDALDATPVNVPSEPRRAQQASQADPS